jgi:hypothetical protein
MDETAAAFRTVERTGSCLALLRLALDGAVPKVLLEMVADYVGPVEPESGSFILRTSETRNWHGYVRNGREHIFHSNAEVRRWIADTLQLVFVDVAARADPVLPVELRAADAQAAFCTFIRTHALSIQFRAGCYFPMHRLTTVAHLPTRQRTKSRMPVFALYWANFYRTASDGGSSSTSKPLPT